MITIFGFALQKRTVISVLVALLVSAAFWSGSRYPELDAKAAMGGDALHNTVMGIVIGAPLGLCVDCAAPVAKGLHHSRARLETTLAAMMSAPTLNVLVLTMLFTMFPPYMAIAKLAGSLVFILIVIPVMSRYVFHEEPEATIENSSCAVEQLTLSSAAASEAGAKHCAVRPWSWQRICTFSSERQFPSCCCPIASFIP